MVAFLFSLIKILENVILKSLLMKIYFVILDLKIFI
jgi:hypothetical protein